MTAQQLNNLAEIRSVLGEKRTALAVRHRRVEQDLQRRLDPLVADSSDRAIQLQNDEALHAIDDATQAELAAIDEALQRLDRGLYGICKLCGGEIEVGRLKSLHAVVCAKCANGGEIR